jgi:hypothetical protein
LTPTLAPKLFDISELRLTGMNQDNNGWAALRSGNRGDLMKIVWKSLDQCATGCIWLDRAAWGRLSSLKIKTALPRSLGK